ncbi:MAG: ABC transporter permease [Alkalibacterium sp.]|nr:ABC transporter permease [Alkalibacterium sp.]
MESVQPGALIPRMILGLVVLLVIFSGSIRTLVEPADAVFLLPKEKSFSNIMKKNLLYSLIFHGFFTVLAGFLSAPLLTAVNHMGLEEQVFWIMSLLLWKITHGILTYHQLKQQRTEIIWTIRTLIRLMTVTGLAFSLFLSVMIGFFSALLATVVFSVYVLIYSQSENWNWESLIETEQKRTQKIYSIINMFIETPYSKHKVKRLKLLDFFYKLPVLNQNVEIYYLSRMFIRNYNFSGLYLRLLTIGSIAIYFSTNWMIESVSQYLVLISHRLSADTVEADFQEVSIF